MENTEIEELLNQEEISKDESGRTRVRAEIHYYLYGELFVEPYSSERYLELLQLSNIGVKQAKNNCSPTKCFDCQHAFANDCFKVSIGAQKGLDLFPFIDVAIQVIYDDGTLDSFYVADCKNFELDKPRTMRDKAIGSKAAEALCEDAFFTNACSKEVKEVLNHRQSIYYTRVKGNERR